MTASLITSLCALFGATMLLTACGGGSAADPGMTAGGSGDSSGSASAPVLPINQSALARDLNPDVSSADLAAVVGGNNQFALQAFEDLMPSGVGNLVFSPYGIIEAVAMPAAGAQGNTLAGIDQALSFALPQARLYPALDKLSLTLQGATSGSFDAGSGQAPSLNIANGVWAQAGFAILPSYLDTLATSFGTGIVRADFVNAPNVATAAINAWAAQKTDNRIQNLVPLGALNANTSMVLANAILFKGGWQVPFPAGATQNAPFNTYGGGSTSVPFMNLVASFPYAKVAGAQAVDLPFTGNDVSMLILVPDAGTIDSWQAGLTPTVLNGIVAQLSGSSTYQLSLPRFSFFSSPDIAGTLKSLGMTDAFSKSAADFSGIDGQPNLYISALMQQADVSVDENGAAAAAATVVVVSPTSVVQNPPQPQFSLNVNHPFLFFIRERSTGTILFMGRVGQIGA